MFGSKLRAWMDAVRPKKKQYRKDKQGKNPILIKDRPNTNNHTVTWQSSCLLDSEQKDADRDASTIRLVNQSGDKQNGNVSQISRYSTTNLSSPESAYSTGYSTDGTSPGGGPPDYLMNSGTKSTESGLERRLNPDTSTQLPCASRASFQSFSEQTSSPTSVPVQENSKDKAPLEEKDSAILATSSGFFGKIPEPAGLVSPRQRNRIRTNPWLPGGSASVITASPIPIRQEVKVTPMAYRKIRNSPIQYRYLSPATHRRSLSSSSCSSLSAGPNRSFEHRFPVSLSDEDDCTLNEMMGKYDESYVYEKETDILSDSDPTDCESDIDTGQDGGDEEENGELDFIDNGSYVEVDSKADNSGHCMYIIPSDVQRKRSSRKRATRRGKEASDRRRRSSSNKKSHRHNMSEKTRHFNLHQDGSKSAGATPLSMRKSNSRSSPCRTQDEVLKKRSNSVCLQRDVTFLIDKRDREADKKYKELIGQAEQIIRTMNVNSLSPRRLAAPTNKRVELLRSAECVKPEVLFMGKPNDETLLTNSNISPSTVTFKNTRFSPKKNHITNFIINNSPVLVRKELQGQSPVSIRRILPEEGHQSPLVVRRQSYQFSEEIYKNNYILEEASVLPPKNMAKKYAKEHHDVTFGSPICSRRSHKPKSILHKTDSIPAALLSPRHRRESEFPVGSSSSEEEDFQKYKKKLSKSCPQSEPMRRKVYFGRNTINFGRSHGKMVAFNLTKEVTNPPFENKNGSSENLRQQVLLNTIQNLKKNLEDHSASLKQTYRSTQNMYKY